LTVSQGNTLAFIRFPLPSGKLLPHFSVSGDIIWSVVSVMRRKAVSSVKSSYVVKTLAVGEDKELGPDIYP
jgi:hypothetical protein